MLLGYNNCAVKPDPFFLLTDLRSFKYVKLFALKLNQPHLIIFSCRLSISQFSGLHIHNVGNIHIFCWFSALHSSLNKQINYTGLTLRQLEQVVQCTYRLYTVKRTVHQINPHFLVRLMCWMRTPLIPGVGVSFYPIM